MKKILFLIIISAAFVACKKINVTTPSLDIITEKMAYKAGDTVFFKIESSADNIVFYSGEPGFNYNYKNRTTAAGKPVLTFTSYLQNAGELNTLRLLVSTNFTGVFDSTNVRAATWDDITDKAILSKGTDNTSSGTMDLSAYGDKPVYFAYRYQGYYSATLKQPTWTLRTFNISNLLQEGNTYPITTIDVAGWAKVDFLNATIGWSLASSGQASVNGTIAGAANSNNDDWIISRKVNLKSVAPDSGTSIKYLSSEKLDSYSYIFNTPGTYNVTFEGFNNSKDDQTAVVKTITLSIMP